MTEQKALAWIANIFEEPVENIRPDVYRGDIPGWDSLGILALMAGLDEEFDIRLSEQEIPALQTVQDILAILKRHGRLP
jgi:acyl carrier protein